MGANAAPVDKGRTGGGEALAAADAFLSTAGARIGAILRYLIILLEFGLILILIYRFGIESRAFLHLGILAFFGWAVHYFLPQRLRLAFFVLLSLAGILLVFGFQEESWRMEGLVQGLWIIGIGMVLIGLCHLGLPFWYRVGLVLAIGILLAAARTGAVVVPWSVAIWPVIASMFMFRLIVYLYQIRHDARAPKVTESLAYFFMLPNVCFPLFPVVDFQTFRRSHYTSPDRFRVYQTGIHWILRGMVHLLCYRLVYYNLVNDVTEISTRTDFFQFMLWPFLLYLRVSGTFHIITGLLHLFGFALPETHKLYFLSGTFTEFWRRINIYWKDFIMKIIYYPVYFRSRKFGDRMALVIATATAFFMTWVLHGFQWFWLRGTWLLTWNDFLFWALLAMLVTVNALYETRFGRHRRLAGKALPWRDALVGAARTLGVFTTIAVLWSFWSAESVAGWLSSWRGALQPSAADGRLLVLILAVLTAIGGASLLVARGLAERPFSFARSAGGVIAAALLLIGLAQPQVGDHLGSTAKSMLAQARDHDLNRRDFARLERGYYENLMDAGAFNPELMEVYRMRPIDWRTLDKTDGAIDTGSLPMFVLRPSFTFRHKGVEVHTNRWGMRDRDYGATPPAGTVRIAVVGASFVFGDGVPQDSVFEAVLERQLNRNSEAEGGVRYELLNFGVGGYAAIERLAVIDRTLAEFHPGYLFFFEHRDSTRQNVAKIVRMLRERRSNPYPFIEELVRRAGIDPAAVDRDSDRETLMRRLRPFEEPLLGAIYERIVARCRDKGVTPVWIYLPRPEKFAQGGPPPLELDLARRTGFHILDLSGVYAGHSLPDLWIARWDHHPNAVGHRLIAERLLAVLRQAPDLALPGLAPAAVPASRPSPTEEE